MALQHTGLTQSRRAQTQQAALVLCSPHADFLPAELIAEGVVPCCIRILQNGATVLRAVSAQRPRRSSRFSRAAAFAAVSAVLAAPWR